MSRRRDHSDRHKAYTMIEFVCGANEDHRIGKVWRRPNLPSPGLLSPGIQRIDGPNGETKLLAVCEVCAATGSKATPQIRWDRVSTMLDDMEAGGLHYRRLATSDF